MQKAFLVGRLTRDVEQKMSGDKVLAKFGLATNRQRNGKNEVHYFEMEAWGQQAEVLLKYAKKGTQIAVDATILYDSWVTSNGEKRNRHKFVIDKFDFVGNKSKNSEEEKDEQINESENEKNEVDDDDDETENEDLSIKSKSNLNNKAKNQKYYIEDVPF
ncbi:MAG: single-stranded DNA-binding protein [Endomicrobiia bacterium]